MGLLYEGLLVRSCIGLDLYVGIYGYMYITVDI